MLMLIAGLTMMLFSYIAIVKIKNEGVTYFENIREINSRFGLLKLNLWMTIISSIFVLIVMVVASLVFTILGARIVLLHAI